MKRGGKKAFVECVCGIDNGEEKERRETFEERLPTGKGKKMWRVYVERMMERKEMKGNNLWKVSRRLVGSG